ncbi:hypothetical protein DF156_25220 [Burkholderia ubonensis]|nr:hypothetical protein DF155_24365 [Burkholderia ubonensis]RQP32576.1 hypothetical protein DF154_27090 [Burkholderia ubonensis]RQP35180.1 hypothetical protein DF156_25220 [Burkholderia ubonensis]RQP50083.1 hypothetical protein DF144_23370 [Burkholderia ubonensis]RQP54156.1 hypothetical protein DF151_25120 [Burkholderia ubonensis]
MGARMVARFISAFRELKRVHWRCRDRGWAEVSGGIVVWSKTPERAAPPFWRNFATGRVHCMDEAFAERGVSALRIDLKW